MIEGSTLTVKNSEYVVVSSGYMPYVVVGKGRGQILSSTSYLIYAEIVVKVGATIGCGILNGIVAIKLDVGSDVPAVVRMVVATLVTIFPITNTLVTTVPTEIVIALRCDIESTWIIVTFIESDFPKTSGVVLGVCYAYNSVISVIVC